MNIKKFSYLVEERIRDRFPEEIRESLSISVHPVNKTNDTLRYGLMIQRKEENMSPVLYLDDAWREYESGKPIETILTDLAAKYMEHQGNCQMELSMEFEQVKDRVCYHVVNKAVNQNNLNGRIYTDIGQGFVKVYEIHQKLDQVGAEGSIAITHDLLKDYGYDLKEICQNAEKNTPQIYPVYFTTLSREIMGVLGDEFANENPIEPDFYLLTNENRYRGAGALFYPGMQEKIAEHLGENYYMLPSSIHEVLIVPENMGFTPEELEQMVRGVNEKAVSKDEFLSNKVFYYDREKEQLRIALPDIPDIQKENSRNEIDR